MVDKGCIGVGSVESLEEEIADWLGGGRIEEICDIEGEGRAALVGEDVDNREDQIGQGQHIGASQIGGSVLDDIVGTLMPIHAD